MRQQSLGMVLVLALFLMTIAIADGETNSTDTNSTDNTTANNTTSLNETGNSTANETANDTLTNETNTTLGNETDANETGGTNLTNETNTTIGNGTETNETNLTNSTETNETEANETELTNSTGDNQTENNETELNETDEEQDEDEEPEIGPSDEHEVGNFLYPHGAEVRLLQLERRVTRNILVGTKVIEVLGEADSEADLSALEATLEEMETLLKEIKEASRDENLAGNRTQLAKIFVDLKKSAIDLTKEFRDEARPYLNSSIKREIKDAMDEIDKEALRNITEEIQHRKCEFNAKRIEAMLSELNATNPELVSKIAACNATMHEINHGIMDAFRNATFDHMKDLRDKSREKKIKGNILKKEILKEVKANFTERHILRENFTTESINNKHNKMKAMNMTDYIHSINERIADIREMEEGMGVPSHGLKAIGKNIMPGGPKR